MIHSQRLGLGSHVLFMHPAASMFVQTLEVRMAGHFLREDIKPFKLVLWVLCANVVGSARFQT
jgi:hypothetical protein